MTSKPDHPHPKDHKPDHPHPKDHKPEPNHGRKPEPYREAEQNPRDPERLRRHAEGARVAEVLRSRGLPVMGIEIDQPDVIKVSFRLPDGELRTFAHAADTAMEHLDAYAEAYAEACAAIGRAPIEEA